MIKKQLYPKTRRCSQKNNNMITEKLDGSNLGLFRINNKLLVAQRKFYFYLEEINKIEELLPGLKSWLKEHGEILLENLYEGSGFFSEWIKGNNKISSNRIFMFAKANINTEMDVYNIYYDHKLFKYPFKKQMVPGYISIVPLVSLSQEDISIEALDKLYDEYSIKVKRNVEGFIVIKDKVSINKYVRMKGGKLTPHYEGKQ